MNNDEQAEALALVDQMEAYFEALIMSGMPEPVVMTAVMMASTQRVLRRGTPTQTAAWLRGHALNIERHGAELKVGLG